MDEPQAKMTSHVLDLKVARSVDDYFFTSLENIQYVKRF